MAKDVARVTMTCRLTKDPELRHTQSGTSVAGLRVAWTSSRKDAAGNWEDKPNYCDVTVWGRQAETCAEYLAKGRRIAVDGRLEWREWEAEDGSKRQALEVIAESVVFLDKAPEGGGVHDAGSQHAAEHFVPAGTGPVDDDIPF